MSDTRIAKFIQAVTESLKKIAQEQRGSKEEWTNAVKGCLLDVAQDKEFDLSSNCHFQSFPNKYQKNDNTEWLYDIILYKATSKSLNEIWLCGESEWSRNIDDIFWDFSKLLVARCKLRLFVFCAASKEKYNEILKQLKAYVNESAICEAGETYLFVCYVGANDDPEIHLHKRT
jgi:hypothetical protein